MKCKSSHVNNLISERDAKAACRDYKLKYNARLGIISFSMFFRTKTTPSGTVLQLIESYRNAEAQPRQRVIISLGDAAIADSDKPLVAKAVERTLRGDDQLLQVEAPESVHHWSELIVRRIRARAPQAPPASAPPAPTTVVDSVLLDQITHDSTALLGGVLVGHEAWDRLDMDKCLERLGFNPAQRSAAALNVINRFVDPVSENALSDWVASTALPELMGAQVLDCPRDRFYRVSDALLDKRREIEAHLRRRQKELFGLDRTLVLYDLTNTYFEGEAAANPKARRGKSKEKRDDCPQLVVGMAFDEHGFELAHEVFQGGTSDSKTLPAMKSPTEEVPRRRGRRVSPDPQAAGHSRRRHRDQSQQEVPARGEAQLSCQ